MVTREQVRHVAELARLRLTPEQEEQFQGQLDRILTHVRELEQLEEHEDVCTHGALVEKALRPDEPGASLPRESLLNMAPVADDEAFRVPPVLDGEGGA